MRYSPIYRIFLLAMFCWLAEKDLFAQSKFLQRFHPDSLVKRKLSFIPIPVLQSSPETGLKGGLALDYFFNAGTSGDRKIRDSFAWIQGLYSARNQLALEVFWQVYTKDEKWFLRNRGGYIDFNEYYWGVGNNTVPEDDYTNFFYQRVYNTGKVLRKTKDKIFAGLNYNFSDTWDIFFTGGFGDNKPFGSKLNATRVSGVGPNIIFDFRDNPFSPVRGWYLELGTHHYRSFLGSRSTYDEYLIDARKYFKVFKKDFFGVQFLGNFTQGDMPFRELNRLGGPNMMRGFFQGRFRDKQHVAAQIEYRKPLNRFLQVAAFTSAGQVFEELDGWKWQQMRYAGGLGLRVLINKEKNIYSRFDFAVTDIGTNGFYFRIADAF
ncbi:BamA/TamA family outer membrane protein [Rhodoflexus sp.]